ncbi:hypothetical protein Q1695_012252 [Nippostrongylus brasiliensis]|nr:hypothetical protein Q1695_012252 [Nippostrongylus brasiliensis]
MAKTCPHCGSCDIDEDAGRGDATCTACGTVLEESIVVSENQFQERSGSSGHTLVGQFVSIERGQAQARAGANGIVSQESREVTFAKGRKLIEEIASQLRINQHCIDTSYNFFKMSVSRNLTRGRVRSHVVAACLYMTCRLENTAHLLLDFSDVTQVNMFDLGRTLNFLSRSLRINLPSTDPCLYILRFACLMEFGDKQKEVVNLATRLVQRMKRDWMSTGRRPTGLCGAALLLAARAYNFNRTIGDVVKVVHISESVVRKRLDEFSKTPSSALTIDEFSTIDLDHEEDPPAFQESRRKAREEQLAKEAELAAQMERDVIPMEDELERALEKKRRERFRNTRYAKMVAGEIDDPEVGVAEGKLVQNEIMDSVFRAADEEPETPNYSMYAPSLVSLGITQPKTNIYATPPVYPILPPHDRPDGSLDLTGIDDDEIDTYILTETESAMKERFWMKLNGEHMKEMERRRKEREEEEEKEKGNPSKKKRKRTAPSRQNMSASTAMEAMEKIIHEKKLSNKVNYEILKEIEHTASGIEPVGMEDNATKVIENVNNLVATLGMDKASLAEEASVPYSLNVTPENMTPRERELARRNKPLKDSAALRMAFKMEPTTSNGTEAPENDKPIALSRCTRFARSVRPNLAKGSKSARRITFGSTIQMEQKLKMKTESQDLTEVSMEQDVKPRLIKVKMSPTHSSSDGDAAVSSGRGDGAETAEDIEGSEEPLFQLMPSMKVEDGQSRIELNHKVEQQETGQTNLSILCRIRRAHVKPRLLSTSSSTKEGSSTEQNRGLSESDHTSRTSTTDHDGDVSTEQADSAVNDNINEAPTNGTSPESSEKPSGEVLSRRRRNHVKPLVLSSTEKKGDEPQSSTIGNDSASEKPRLGSPEERAATKLTRSRPRLAPAVLSKSKK